MGLASQCFSALGRQQGYCKVTAVIRSNCKRSKRLGTMGVIQGHMGEIPGSAAVVAQVKGCLASQRTGPIVPGCRLQGRFVADSRKAQRVRSLVGFGLVGQTQQCLAGWIGHILRRGLGKEFARAHCIALCQQAGAILEQAG